MRDAASIDPAVARMARRRAEAASQVMAVPVDEAITFLKGEAG